MSRGGVCLLRRSDLLEWKSYLSVFCAFQRAVCNKVYFDTGMCVNLLKLMCDLSYIMHCITSAVLKL